MTTLTVEANNLTRIYGGREAVSDVSFTLSKGEVLGFLGPNGAGKSTLFKLITGQEKPDAGTIKVGETVKLAYVDQSRDALDASKTVWQEISSGLDMMKVGSREISSRAYVGAFNFKGGDQQKKVGILSGGERNRVHLAKTLASGGNLILLDEPTNDLDIETLQALEEALEEFIVLQSPMFIRVLSFSLAIQVQSYIFQYTTILVTYNNSSIYTSINGKLV